MISCGSGGRGTGLEGLERDIIESESAEEGTRFGIGRLTIGHTGGGERPCGSEGGVGGVSSNR